MSFYIPCWVFQQQEVSDSQQKKSATTLAPTPSPPKQSCVNTPTNYSLMIHLHFRGPSTVRSKEIDEKADEVLKLEILDYWTPENHYRWSKSINV